MEIKELAQKIKNMEPGDRKKLAYELEKPEPTIFKEFPVGSYICGIKVLEHDLDTEYMPIKLLSGNRGFWIRIEILNQIIACHDWILKYHPVIEAAREWANASKNYNPSDFLTPKYTSFAAMLEKTGLWKNPESVKLPWEESHE